MRPQAELGGPGSGEDNGFNLKGAARAREAGGGWKDYPTGSLVLCQMLEGNRTERTLHGFISVLGCSD